MSRNDPYEAQLNAARLDMESWKRKQQAHGCRVVVYAGIVVIIVLAAIFGLYMFGLPDLGRLDFYQWMLELSRDPLTGEPAINPAATNAALLCVGAGMLAAIGVFTGLALLLHFTPEDWRSESGEDGFLI